MIRLFRYFSEIFAFLGGCFWFVIRGNDSKIAALLRRKIYRTECQIDTNVFIKNPKNFKADAGSCLYHSCYILNPAGDFIIGEKSHLGAFCYVNVCYGSVTIGKDTAIGPGTKIIAYSNHYGKGKKVSEMRKTGSIRIGNNVLIGANCVILPGTTIEDNVIVAAGSVVRGILTSNQIYGSVSSKVIKTGWFSE